MLLVLKDTEVNRPHSELSSTRIWRWVSRSQRGVLYDWIQK